DVLVNDDHHAVEVGERAHLRGEEAGLSGVAGVHLPDRDDVQQAAPAHRVAVYPGDAGDAGVLEGLAQQPGPEVLPEVVRLVRRLFWRASQKARIVSMVDG